MYTIRFTARFQKNARECRRNGKNMEELRDVLRMLEQDGRVPDEYSPHLLHEEYAGCWECHIEDDWLLVWRQDDARLTMLMTNTGTHDELFRKKK